MTSLRQLCPQHHPVPVRSGRRGRRRQPRADPGALPGVQDLSHVSKEGHTASTQVHSGCWISRQQPRADPGVLLQRLHDHHKRAIWVCCCCL